MAGTPGVPGSRESPGPRKTINGNTKSRNRLCNGPDFMSILCLKSFDCAEDGLVASAHHQALGNAAHLEVIGVSDDGVIEAIRDPSKPFYVGVQWHPERTDDTTMGLGVIRRLVDAARRE